MLPWGEGEEEELEEEGGERHAGGAGGRGSHTIRPDYISILFFQQRLQNTLHTMVRTVKVSSNVTEELGWWSQGGEVRVVDGVRVLESAE